MKRTLMTLMAVLMLGTGFAQVLSTTDAALVYYMPKNLLAFDVEYTETVCTQGPFYQYAERYLGTKDVVMADETRYELTDVKMGTKTVADKNRAYVYSLSKNQRACLTLDQKGILVAYNADAPESKAKPNKRYDKKERKESVLAPLSEETLLATSKAKMAESTAKQIYRIREARTNLLAGDVDRLPADSKALALTLQKLDDEEEALVKLFVGEKQVQVKHKIIYVEPEHDVTDSTLLRFSRYAGPVAADDMSGEPIVLTLNVHKQVLAESTDKKQVPLSEIYYNLPGDVTVVLTDADGNELVNKELPIAQLGVSVALPQSLISRKPHILFDPKTGAIISINE